MMTMLACQQHSPSDNSDNNDDNSDNNDDDASMSATFSLCTADIHVTPATVGDGPDKVMIMFEHSFPARTFFSFFFGGGCFEVEISLHTLIPLFSARISSQWLSELR